MNDHLLRRRSSDWASERLENDREFHKKIIFHHGFAASGLKTLGNNNELIFYDMDKT